MGIHFDRCYRRRHSTCADGHPKVIMISNRFFCTPIQLHVYKQKKIEVCNVLYYEPTSLKTLYVQVTNVLGRKKSGTSKETKMEQLLLFLFCRLITWFEIPIDEPKQSPTIIIPNYTSMDGFVGEKFCTTFFDLYYNYTIFYLKINFHE